MILIIDIGNSNMTFSIYKEGKCVDSLRLKTDPKYTSDEAGIYLYNFLLFKKYPPDDIKYAVCASVAPGMNNVIKQAVQKYLNCDFYLIGTDIPIKMENLYDNPLQTGIDRLVNAYGAGVKYGAPCIVVDMGTATTYDVLDSKGRFAGGVIFPGVKLMAQSLSGNTSLLPEVQFKRAERAIGKNTTDCILSGLYYGYNGALENILRNLMQEMEGDVKVIVTGGLAGFFDIDVDFIRDEMLTSDSIYMVFDSWLKDKRS